MNLGAYFFVDPQNYDEKVIKKYWNDVNVSDRLYAFYERLNDLEVFISDIIEKTLRNLADELAISAAKLIHPTRLALTGFGVSPGLFELMEVLGKKTVLRRIKKAIQQLNIS